MASSQRIKVMLSSRCTDRFSTDDPVPLSTLRRELKRAIEAERLLGQQPFEVWINEDAEALDHTADSWEHCLAQVKRCDVLIVLYNGNAGWAKTGADIGICHAEYAEGLKYGPGKVRLVELPAAPAAQAAQRARNARFADFKDAAAAFRGGEVHTRDALAEQVRNALFDAVLTQTRRGGEGAKGGRYDLGAALAWSRLDFTSRRAAMIDELAAALAERRPSAGAQRAGDDVLPVLELGGTLLGIALHAVPAAFSVAAAREPLGRPHLRDHQALGRLAGHAGPLYVVACHRGVTETQATSLLGFPDATVVSAPFGVYLADDVQKTQFVFLANCRDPVQTRLALQRLIDWTEQSGEARRLAERAAARARIAAAIAREQAPA